ALTHLYSKDSFPVQRGRGAPEPEGGVMIHFDKLWQNWLFGAGLIAGAIIISLVIRYVVFCLLDRRARRTKHIIDISLARHGRGPTKLMFPLIALLLVVPLVPVRSAIRNPAEHVIGVALIVVVAWLIVLTADVFTDLLVSHYRVDVADNLQARRMKTQALMLRRIFAVLVAIVTVAIILLTIPHVRAVGTSFLASAGLAGLVIGLAMKPTLGNLVAGVQIALTQPIRLEDAVIVEGDWGWIEEINSTYVVVRTWDWRRLVLPLTYFIEHPFQNWTKTNAELIGSVHLHVDYTVPLAELRKELDRVVHSTDKWRGSVVVLQVVDATATGIQLRILADANDAGTAWDLRCYIREQLIVFLQEHYPHSLPRVRAEMHPLPLPTRSVEEAPNSSGDGDHVPPEPPRVTRAGS
ncbi:MAG: mechanosensitive ion channel family protein, partial [Terriglobia bacterium]